jgi:hypothetical protein
MTLFFYLMWQVWWFLDNFLDLIKFLKFLASRTSILWGWGGLLFCFL